VIIECGTRIAAGKTIAQFFKIGRIAPVDPQRNQAGHGNAVERARLAEPRLQQPLGGLVRQRVDLHDTGDLRQEQRHLGGALFHIDAFQRLKLNGDFARNVASPGRGRLVDHVNRPGCQAGQKTHDRDHEGE